MSSQTQTERVVIVGAGQAGADTATALRKSGFTGAISLVGDEPSLPYRRPPLSKAYLSGDLDPARLLIRSKKFFDDQHIDIIQGPVEAINRAAHTVSLRNGNQLGYDKLVLATGAPPRQLPEIANATNVHVLRSIGDAERIREACRPGSRMLVIGGGVIGLEVAATANAMGVFVTVIEAASRVMERFAPPSVSAFLQQTHQKRGINILTGTMVHRYVGADAISAVALQDGSTFAVDTIVVGVGVRPNIALAQQAGLDINNGILTDTHCVTSDSDILAVGDCSNAFNQFYGQHLRLESVGSATAHAATAAATICGDPVPYDAVPFFWSDQADLKIQVAGLPGLGDTTIIRGDPVDGAFLAFELCGETLSSVCSINSPREFAQARKLVEQRAKVPVEQLTDGAKALID